MKHFGVSEFCFHRLDPELAFYVQCWGPPFGVISLSLFQLLLVSMRLLDCWGCPPSHHVVLRSSLVLPVVEIDQLLYQNIRL